MRLRSISSIVVVVWSVVMAAPGSRAVAQIELAQFDDSNHVPDRASRRRPNLRPRRVRNNPCDNRRRLRRTPLRAMSRRPPSRTTAPVRAPVRHYDVRPANFVAPTTAPSLPQPQMTSRAPSLAGVYAGTSAQATLSKMPGPTPVQPKPAAQPTRRRGKPFQSVQSEPAISPYMNLYRTDANASNLPNYFAFVRPQLDQIEANRQQAAELQKLRGQLQNISSAGAGIPQSPSMSTSARYMDTAQFYGGMQR